MLWNKPEIAGFAACLLIALAVSPATLAKKKPAGADSSAVLDLPASDAVVPDRPGALFVDRNCLSCHSAETITNQPALTRDIWLAEVEKMRTAFGARIDPDDVEAIVSYLATTNGVRRDKWR